jgi:hypothetical protein
MFKRKYKGKLVTKKQLISKWCGLFQVALKECSNDKVDIQLGNHIYTNVTLDSARIEDEAGSNALSFKGVKDTQIKFHPTE